MHITTTRETAENAHLRSSMVDQAYYKAAERAGRVRFIHFKRTGKSTTVRILSNEDGKATRVLTRRPDNTIRDSWTTAAHDPALYTDYKQFIDGEVRTRVNLITSEVIRISGLAAYAECCGANERGLSRLIRKNALSMTHSTLSRCIMPSGPRHIQVYRLHSELNRLIRAQLINPEARSLVKALTEMRGPLTTGMYNDMVRNREGLESAMTDNKALTSLYFHHAMKAEDRIRNLNDVRENLAKNWEIPSRYVELLEAVRALASTRGNEKSKTDIMALCTAMTMLGMTAGEAAGPKGRALAWNTGQAGNVARAGSRAMEIWVKLLPEALGHQENLIGGNIRRPAGMPRPPDVKEAAEEAIRLAGTE